jgi:glycosyltransferase involved in cell wall biosynthesis
MSENRILKDEEYQRREGMDVSVVIPVYNEEESLPILHDEIQTSLNAIDVNWEVVYVNDGSKDQSQEVLEELAMQDPEHVLVVAFRRNFGQTPAMAAGIDHASGDVIVLMDGDLQNDPADIPMLLNKIDEGFDLVSGWRKDRQDKALTRVLPSKIANWLISTTTGVHLHDYGCSLKAYKREVLEGFRLYGEMHRFIPAFANMVGAKITEVPVNHRARQFGVAKYGLERTIKVILDLFTVRFLEGFGNKPIYLFGTSGIGAMFVGFLGLLFLFIRRFVAQGPVANSPIFLISVVFILIGFQMIFMGLIAELVIRTYHESANKAIYHVRYIVDNRD